MAIPRIIDIIELKEWEPKVTEKPCYLYDLKSMGIKEKEFSKLFSGKKAVLLEKPFTEKLAGSLCPWCDFKAQKNRGSNELINHIFSHTGKTILSYQLVKFQKEMHSIKLQFIRGGYHEAVPFFVEYSCQDCLDPFVKGREGMCAIPVSSRPRMRSLKLLGYPIDHLVNNKFREYKWSALGVIVLMKNELNPGPEI